MKYIVYKGLLEKAFKLTESGKKWVMVKNIIDDLAEESADVKDLAQKAVNLFEEGEYWHEDVKILRAVEGTFRALLKSEKHEAARIDREYGFYAQIEGGDAEIRVVRNAYGVHAYRRECTRSRGSFWSDWHEIPLSVYQLHYHWESKGFYQVINFLINLEGGRGAISFSRIGYKESW